MDAKWRDRTAGLTPHFAARATAQYPRAQNQHFNITCLNMYGGKKHHLSSKKGRHKFWGAQGMEI
jgi:hypothetical protein